MSAFRLTPRFRRNWLRALLVAPLIALGASVTQAQETIPLASFHSAAFGDFFTTSDPAWTCRLDDSCTSGWVNPNYAVHAMEGHVFNPALPRPIGALPLWHWYSEVRNDNFTTANPAWDPAAGTTRYEGGANYTFIRLVGYIKSATANTHLKLTTYWNGAIGDNASLATAKLVPDGRGSTVPVRVPTGYGVVRVDGSLLPPPSLALERCRTGLPQTLASASWPAFGNFINPAPANDVRSVVKRFSAPEESYRIDYWGTSKSVRGDATVTRAPFPAPGNRAYAAIAQVTDGRIYVDGQGWHETGQWFRALGTTRGQDGPCMLHEGSTGRAGEMQIRFNDSNLSDNSGGANVTTRQWWE